MQFFDLCFGKPSSDVHTKLLRELLRAAEGHEALFVAILILCDVERL